MINHDQLSHVNIFPTVFPCFPPKMSEDPQKHQNWSSLVDEFEALDLP